LPRRNTPPPNSGRAPSRHGGIAPGGISNHQSANAARSLLRGRRGIATQKCRAAANPSPWPPPPPSSATPCSGRERQRLSRPRPTSSSDPQLGDRLAHYGHRDGHQLGGIVDLADQCMSALESVDAQQIAVAATITPVDTGAMRVVIRNCHSGVGSPMASAPVTPAC